MTEITIRKGNVELNVPADQKDRYLNLGYSVYEKGKLVEEAPTNDVGALQAKIITLNNTITELNSENSKLKAEIKKLKSKKAE